MRVKMYKIHTLTMHWHVWHMLTWQYIEIFAWAGKMFPRNRSFWSGPRRRMMMMNKWIITHAPRTHGSWLTEYANVAKADDNADECTGHIAQIDEACWTYEKRSCHTDQSVTPRHMSSYLICRWEFLHKKWDHLFRKTRLFISENELIFPTNEYSTFVHIWSKHELILWSKSQLMSLFASTIELTRSHFHHQMSTVTL